MRSTSTIICIVLALGAGGFGGCSSSSASTHSSTPVRPRGEAAGVPASFDGRLVDPRFERAVAEFSKNLRSVRMASDPEVELRHSVRLLAIALEKVPYAGQVDVELAASRIRGGRPHGRATPFLAYGVGGASRAVSSSVDVERSLQVVAETFVELARGPYRSGTGVIGPAYELDATVRAIANGSGAQRRCDRAVRALDQAEAVLLALRAAVGRGEVGLVTQAPPPVAWGP